MVQAAVAAKSISRRLQNEHNERVAPIRAKLASNGAHSCAFSAAEAARKAKEISKAIRLWAHQTPPELTSKKKRVVPEGVRMLLQESTATLRAAEGARKLTLSAINNNKVVVSGKRVQRRSSERSAFLDPLQNSTQNLSHSQSDSSLSSSQPNSGRHVENYRVVRRGFGLQPLGSKTRTPMAIALKQFETAHRDN